MRPQMILDYQWIVAQEILLQMARLKTAALTEGGSWECQRSCSLMKLTHPLVAQLAKGLVEAVIAEGELSWAFLRA